MSLPAVAPPARPAPNVVEAIREALPRLRRSERAVAETVLADPRRVLGETLAGTAALAGVSQPTVVRFAVAVGCSGYSDFRLRLAHSLALGTPATHSVILESDGLEDVVGKIFDYTISSLDWARRHLDPGALARAVELLENATALAFFGFGASGIVAADAQQKFPLFGVPCTAETDAHQQIMAATMLRPTDVAVAISNTGRTRTVLEATRLARAAGAKVVAVTGSDSPLARAADVALVVETLDNTDVYTPTISRIAALVVVDVLSTAVALRRDAGRQARFRAMKASLNDQREGGG